MEPRAIPLLWLSVPREVLLLGPRLLPDQRLTSHSVQMGPAGIGEGQLRERQGGPGQGQGVLLGARQGQPGVGGAAEGVQVAIHLADA